MNCVYCGEPIANDDRYALIGSDRLHLECRQELNQELYDYDMRHVETIPEPTDEELLDCFYLDDGVEYITWEKTPQKEKIPTISLKPERTKRIEWLTKFYQKIGIPYEISPFDIP